MIPIAEWVHAAIVLMALLGMVLLVEAWTRRTAPPPELSRKVVHMLGGLGSLALPWWLHAPGLVAGLAVLSAALLYLGQRRGTLRCLAAVNRRGAGSAYFPLAILLLFLVARERPWLYVTTVLIITVSDAAAALVGGAYGRFHFHVGREHRKSLEGSIFFWLLSFLAIHLPLLLMTNLPRETCVLAALLLSLLLTGVEAISTRGTDNILVPLFACYGLIRITTKPPAEIAFQVVSLLALMVVMEVLFRVIKVFSIRDSIIFLIFTYAVWSLGSAQWAAPVLACFLLFFLVRRLVPNHHRYVVETTPLLRVILVPMSVLLLANATGRYQELFVPFLGAVLAAFVCVSWAYVLYNRRPRGRAQPLTAMALGALAAFVVTTGSMLIQPDAPLMALLTLPATAGLSMAFYDLYLRQKTGALMVRGGSDLVMWIALAAALAGAGLQALGLVAPWHPVH